MDKTEPIVIADAGPVIHLDELSCLYLLAEVIADAEANPV